MSNVDDHGLEVIKKAAEYTNPLAANKKSDYFLKVGLFGNTAVPYFTDAVTVDYPSSTIEVYNFRQGGVSGVILKTVTITYTNSTKDFLSTAVWS
jgi:hypothetical protein